MSSGMAKGTLTGNPLRHSRRKSEGVVMQDVLADLEQETDWT